MAAVLEAFDEDGRTEVLPAVLARACVQVLPVFGAGLSYTDELRIPLGASDSMAVRAERLQTTLGEGPCLAATRNSVPLRATGDVMAARWPVFHQELLRQTPYRTIVSVPLQSERRGRFGALDLYSTETGGFSELMLDRICAEVADPIAAILFDGPSNRDRDSDLPAWLASDGVMDRMTVWVAIGMVMEQAVFTNLDALSTLRAYAFTHITTLDELAAQITTRQITPETILAS